MSVNLYLYVSTYQLYSGEPWAWLRVSVGSGLPVARGAAQVLNLK